MFHRLVFLGAALFAALASSAAEEEELHFLAPHHPLAGQVAGTIVVTTSDAAAAATTTMLGHYGQPPADCEDDEKAFQISGVPGMVCAPTCDASGSCPSDLPDGVSARPQCALENRATGDKYCVLICQTTTTTTTTTLLRGTELEDGMCGDATCQQVQPGLGICTYSV